MYTVKQENSAEMYLKYHNKHTEFMKKMPQLLKFGTEKKIIFTCTSPAPAQRQILFYTHQQAMMLDDHTKYEEKPSTCNHHGGMLDGPVSIFPDTAITEWGILKCPLSNCQKCRKIKNERTQINTINTLDTYKLISNDIIRENTRNVNNGTNKLFYYYYFYYMLYHRTQHSKIKCPKLVYYYSGQEKPSYKNIWTYLCVHCPRGSNFSPISDTDDHSRFQKKWTPSLKMQTQLYDLVYKDFKQLAYKYNI